MRKISFSLLFVAAAACTDAAPLGPLAPTTVDAEPPRLDIRAPLRGSILTGQATTVEVSGFVRDEGVVVLLVNGLRARLNADGSFKVDVPVAAGITLLQTVARDGHGHLTTDTRAVLGGPLADAAIPVADAIVAHLDARAIRAGGAAVAQRLGDLGSDLVRENPLHHNTLPCIGSRADLTRLALRVVRLEVSPVYGGLLVDAELADLELGLRVAFSTSCQAVRTEEVAARAGRFHLRGVVHLGLADGRVSVDTSDASGWLDGLTLESTRLPSRVGDELETALVDTLTPRLMEAVAARLPEVLLTGLGVTSPANPTLEVRPTRLGLDAGGATIAVDSTARRGAMYVADAARAPVVEGRAGLAVGIAGDALNQLLASAWAGGAFDRAPRAAPGAGYDRVLVGLRLPPLVRVLADGRVHLVAGDVECHLVDASGATVARLAVSIDTTFDSRVDAGHLVLAARAPALFVDRLAGGPASPRIGGAAELVAADLAAALGDVLAALPLPAASRTMVPEAGTGYLVVAGDVSP